MRSPAGNYVIQPARIQGEYLCRRGQDLQRKKVELKTFRYDPQSSLEPHYDRVEVEVDADMPTTVLDLLRRVQQEHLPDLALHYSCRTGQCGSCTLKINGINRPSCDTRVEGDILTIKPRDNRSIIHDLRVL